MARIKEGLSDLNVNSDYLEFKKQNGRKTITIFFQI